MDRLDWKIIAALEENGRQSFAELGETVGLSKSPCWSRVRSLEEGGVIQGYSARLDPFALGLEVQSFVEVRISLDAHTDFEAAVMAHPAVLECHKRLEERRVGNACGSKFSFRWSQYHYKRHDTIKDSIPSLPQHSSARNHH